MDFRLAPKPSELTWLPPRGIPQKTRTAAATFQGKKLLVQTPECPVRVFRNQGSVTVYLDLTHSEVASDFAIWVESYEDFAAAVHVDCPAAAKSPSIRNGSLRLMIWEDAQWFDGCGVYLKHPPDGPLATASCILEFQGCWVGADKWGLKLRVTQIQVHEGKPPPKAPSAYAFQD